jgi:hypothetical protein
MAVQKHDFEGCCTADILTSFGESHTSEYGYNAVQYDKLWREVVGKVNNCTRHGIVTAILTSEQTTAAKVLKDLGFIGTGPASKDRHPEVTIELFYLHVQGWKEPAKPEEHAVIAEKQAQERPRDAQGRFIAEPAPAVNPFQVQAVAAEEELPDWDLFNDEEEEEDEEVGPYRLFIRGAAPRNIRYYATRVSNRTGVMVERTIAVEEAQEYETEEVEVIQRHRAAHGHHPFEVEAV